MAGSTDQEPVSPQNLPAEFLPPAGLHPDLVFALPELHYPLQCNAATELIDRALDRGWSERTVYICGERRISYAELARDVNRLGSSLRRLGIRAGDRVIIRCPDRPELVVAILALIKLGAIAVPTFTLLRADDLTYREADAEAIAFIVDARLTEEVEAARPRFRFARHFIALGGPCPAGYQSFEDMIEAGDDVLDAAPTRRDDVALLLYTSGSTGSPKGCCESHSDLLAVADGFGTYEMPFHSNDVIVAQPPLPFSLGIGVLLAFPLRFGVAAVLTEEKRPEALLREVERHRATLLFGVPTFMNMAAAAQMAHRFDVSSLRELRVGGETLVPAIAERVSAAFGMTPFEFIGSTESLHIIASNPSGYPPRIGSFGRAIAGFQVVVRDPATFRELPRGETGLLTFRGPTGVKYWRKPEAQASSIWNGWTVLQDLVRMDNEGYGYYVARNDDLIVTAGYNISPVEVETILAQHPCVQECACVPGPDPDGIRPRVVTAYIVLSEGFDASRPLVDDIQTFFKSHGPPHLYPRAVHFIDSLPKTLSGKVQRFELRRQAAAAGAAVSGSRT